MGLATSQARLLMLTTQLNNIDAHLATDSDALMGLSRESSEASKEYANSLNQKKIVDSNTEADVTYGSLMTYNPNISNQYVLTNANGYVVLNDSYIPSGVSANSGTAKDLATDEYAFAAKMMGGKYNAADIKTASAAYEATTSTSSSTSTTAPFLTNYKDSEVYDYLGTKSSFSANGSSVNYPNSAGIAAHGEQTVQVGNDYGSIMGTITDIVSGTAGAVLATLTTGTTSYTTAQIASLKQCASAAATATENFYAGKIGTDLGGVCDDGRNNEDKNDVAREMAGDGNAVTSDAFTDKETYLNATEVSKTFLNFFDAYCAATAEGYAGSYKGDSSDVAAISDPKYAYVSQILGNNTYGASNSYTSSQWSDWHSHPGGTKDTRKTSPLGESGTAAYGIVLASATPAVQPATNPNNIPLPEAEYYIKLYRSIENQGWSRSDNIDKSSAYLQQKLENGSVYINSVTTSGKLTDIPVSSQDSPVSEESDKDAQAKAEAEYQAKKDEINYKENYYNTDQTNTDTQRQEVETSIESTKKVLDTNIQKFKIFTA